MKCILTMFLQLFFLTAVCAQTSAHIVTEDIDNFWTAYDKITTTKDNAEQLAYLNKLFIEKGMPGLEVMIKARRYTPQEYVDAINKRPEYWNSIRNNTSRARNYVREFELGIEKLRTIYPELKPADIYFTVGVFRSGGTRFGSNILIGSEIVFANENLMNNLTFINIHEYVHTQQKKNMVENLLGQSVLEGVAEFIAVKALNIPSTAPAISYGRNNEPRTKNAFSRQMFNTYNAFWLYSDAKNEFNTRDLGYYVGYAIAEKNYEKAKDKKLAIKQMIELNYDDPAAVAKYVDQSGYFPKSVKRLFKEFNKNRPQVTGTDQFKNGDQKVSSGIAQLTIRFSKEMDQDFRNFQFGSLGQKNLIKIKNFIGYAEDGKSCSVEIEPFEPNQRHQLVIGNGFRDKTGMSLKSYAIDITTQVS